MILFLSPEISSHYPSQDPQQQFSAVMSQQGEIYRALENRATKRFVANETTYFVKQHFGIGWKEIIKNLLQLRLPIISAKSEWRAIQKLTALKIPVPCIAGFGQKGINPAHQQSFIITKALTDTINLEDLSRHWKTTLPSFAFKRSLILEIARIARIMHQAGINHRDFYICHFLFAQTLGKIYLLDLHRAQVRKRVPKRWQIKDLAGLYFSSKDIGLTKRDLWRFMREYQQKDLRRIVNSEMTLWTDVATRGEELYQRHEK